MAVVNLAITIPDADIPRFVVATRDAWGLNADGSTKTQAQLVTEWTNRTRAAIVDLVKSYESRVATTSAVATVVPVAAT